MSAHETLAAQQALRSADIDAQVEALYTQLQATAVVRDQQGGHATAERQAIRDSGLLNLSIPKVWGGSGALWSDIYKAIRRLAEADSALAHVFAFHHLQVASIQQFGNAEQHARLLKATVEQQIFWGNALNPLDKRATVTECDGGFVLQGPKSYCSGSVGSDYLLASGWHAASQSAVVVVVPSTRQGVTIVADWDAFGQRQTDSGTVQFDQVQIRHDEVLQGPGVQRTPWATLRTQVSQLILTNLYLGLAQGAFDEARHQIQHHTRPSFFSTAASASQDPYVQHRIAELWLLIRPAVLVADDAARQLDTAWAVGPTLTAQQRGEVAIAVNEAKALAHKASLEVSSQFFELTGARASSQSLGLDRFWRNARVHTLHDPIDYKYRDLGRYLLDGQFPDPTPYS
ncbi:acyl-CoA dehydrogenase family protein [Rhodoferax saidenbachensis]|uniref:Alkylation response protein AidB-like acyl-CoA dehydrogenase n=1 Tax=Rhodoferax saidenbachensis TaxID=1484693 RepID=A0ABU1ZPH5_9BURK|nr:acyl-CoA dehydrogenase family protein [Rhodoferax saidenbachensis]MDR7307432.1 alkylation response protein AidB-like acyl-CoA dehydrogenase [Rhodoferax saidenbachensis]